MSATALGIEQLARRLWGEPSSEHSTREDLRFGTHGSKSVRLKDRTWYDHEAGEGGGYADLYEKVHGERPADASIAAAYDYHDADGRLLFQVVRKAPKTFRQRRPDGNGGWLWDMRGVERVPYRLPALTRAAPNAVVYICEGEKDCDALHERCLIATTNPGGAGKWQAAMSHHLRDRSVVIIPDNDQAGEEHAKDVAAKLRGVARSVRIIRLQGLPDKGDVSDWLAAGGTAEELERLGPEAAQCNGEGEPEQKVSRGTFHGKLLVLGTDDVDTAPPRGYLLKGLLSPAEISIWVGAPKCGKSFLLLHVAYLLSLGRSVFGRRVKSTKVLYVAAEGEAGIANRIRALREKYGSSPDFHFIAQPADLLHHDGQLADLVKAAKALGAQLIVLDTLSRLMAGGDENSPQDMGMFIRNVTQLRHDTQAHVAIVHHGTKASNGSTPRGHGSLTGADDALVEVTKLDDGSRVATVVHAKDDPDGMRWGFTLEMVELGRDDDGDPITTLLVNEKAEPSATASKPWSLSNNEKIALRCLDATMQTNPVMATVGDDSAERRVTREPDWRRTFYREGMPGEEQHTRRVAFKRSVASLLAKGVIAARDDYVWRQAQRR